MSFLEPLDISDLVEQLCARAGIEYAATTVIEIRPGDLRIAYTVLGRNEHGSFYVDQATGQVVSRTHTRRVTA